MVICCICRNFTMLIYGDYIALHRYETLAALRKLVDFRSVHRRDAEYAQFRMGCSLRRKTTFAGIRTRAALQSPSRLFQSPRRLSPNGNIALRDGAQRLAFRCPRSGMRKRWGQIASAARRRGARWTPGPRVPRQQRGWGNITPSLSSRNASCTPQAVWISGTFTAETRSTPS